MFFILIKCIFCVAVRLLITDPKLCFAVYNGVFTAHQYRLVGPGAWSGARQAVLEAIDRLQYPVNATAVDSKRQQCANKSKQWKFMTAAAAVAALCLAIAFVNNANSGPTF